MSDIKSVNVFWDNNHVGRIALTDKGLCVFEYTPEFVNTGVSISPFDLPLKTGVHFAKPTPFAGGFGVFDDAMPDGWGQLILDRYLQKKGIDIKSLTLLDRLCLVGVTGRGALEFRPDKSVSSEDEFSDFEKLASESQHILENDQYYGKGIEEFQKRGGSPGGARPKIFTKFDDREWLVKFRAKEDPCDIGKIEYNYSLLAKECGIEMPDTRLFEDKYFGVERFDRKGDKKFHVISMAGLLNADYRIPSIDYSHIFQAGAILTHSINEQWKIFRLMCFNYLIGNKDDHAKNFAFIFRDGNWRFAPAFDLLPSGGMNGYHTSSFNDSINPKKEDLLSLAVKFGLDGAEAESVFEDMRKKVNK